MQTKSFFIVFLHDLIFRMSKIFISKVERGNETNKYAMCCSFCFYIFILLSLPFDFKSVEMVVC